MGDERIEYLKALRPRDGPAKAVQVARVIGQLAVD